MAHGRRGRLAHANSVLTLSTTTAHARSSLITMPTTRRIATGAVKKISETRAPGRLSIKAVRSWVRTPDGSEFACSLGTPLHTKGVCFYLTLGVYLLNL